MDNSDRVAIAQNSALQQRSPAPTTLARETIPSRFSGPFLVGYGAEASKPLPSSQRARRQSRSAEESVLGETGVQLAVAEFLDLPEFRRPSRRSTARPAESGRRGRAVSSEPRSRTTIGLNVSITSIGCRTKPRSPAEHAEEAAPMPRSDEPIGGQATPATDNQSRYRAAHMQRGHHPISRFRLLIQDLRSSRMRVRVPSASLAFHDLLRKRPAGSLPAGHFFLPHRRPLNIWYLCLRDTHRTTSSTGR